MIPNGWKIEQLENIADYKAGRTPARAKSEFWQDSKANVPWISISDMEEHGIITETKERITEEAFDKIFKKKIVPAGTLIMSYKLTIGRVSTLGIDACHNEAIISIYPKEEINQRFLSYFLSQVDFTTLQDRQVKGNTLNQDKINRIEIWYPTLNKQTQIANVLDMIRQAIQIQDDIIVVAQNLKQSAMHKLFTNGLNEETQKDTEIGPIPESWEIIKIGELFEIRQGISVKRNLSSNTDGIPFLRTSNVYWGQINLDKIHRMHIDSDRVRDLILRKGDLLVCEGGEIGRAAVWNEELEGCIYQNHVHRLRPLQPETVDPHFIVAWLTEGFLHRNVYEGIGNKTTIPNLSRARLAEFPVPIPTFEKQREIASVIDAINNKINLHRHKRDILEKLFKSLLHKLMTGEVHVTDLDLSALKFKSTKVVT